MGKICPGWNSVGRLGQVGLIGELRRGALVRFGEGGWRIAGGMANVASPYGFVKRGGCGSGALADLAGSGSDRIDGVLGFALLG